MKIEELNIDVEDISDYEDEASEILTAFCDDLESKGMTIPETEHDEWWREETGIKFWWNSEASTLIGAELDRLYAIGTKYFPEEKHFTISSHMYREP